ncbi:exodeoxyribonuclease VII large subunit [Lysobacteraceae bacterium NML93-0792]|nr:exodeoxyribonuclease VII large subunit [Xanthomonadaceae bacterium NML93-0792]PBS16465.1 exodeoxyribonuclease VII large subunit [Xanthomonadaceae bacterium NML93-0793]PBS19276.1 exodeoxyribonuclease VII large subunit [Xanthomonadaceae bacterium NML93-0831]
MHDAPASDVLTPSQLNILARGLLEDAFPAVVVEGELGNVSRPASGHMYFTLKDARAQVRCALFKPKSQWLRFVPRDGLQVRARGRVTLYEARGEYQLILDTLEEAGEGALRRAFDALKARLQAEGLFEAARKRALPALPRRLGVITSPSGAAVRDVLSVLGRRFPLLEVEILPALVQGTEAPAQLLRMLQAAGASGRYDVLLLTRGGGSLEDLWAFNDEALVRAVADSPVPVVSAVGHETDFSLTDFAADLRAPTPSAAAELLTPDRIDLLGRTRQLQRHVETAQRRALQDRHQRVDRLGLRLQALRPQARLEALRVRQDTAMRRLAAAFDRQLQQQRARLRHAGVVLQTGSPQRRLQALRQQLDALRARPEAALRRHLQRDALHLRGLARSLEAVSPLATIARGYSILQREDGTVIRHVDDVAPGDALQARLSDGNLRVRVESSDS